MNIESAAHTAASLHGLSAAVVLAVVEVESGGYTWAWNPEPRYRWFWDVRRQRPFREVTEAEVLSEIPPSDFPTLYADRDQEWWGQQASWGLMQVMGAVAREYGFRGKSLVELCDPVLGLEYGCRVIADRLKWSGKDVRKALAAYNGGQGGWKSSAAQAYADKVTATMNNSSGRNV